MGTNIKKRRSEQEYDPQTGRYGYRDESGAFHHNRYSFKPKKGYVVDPDTPQPVGRDAYYWYDKSDKPVNCNVTRKNLRDVDALFKFLAGFCIAAICLVWIHRQIETRSISQTEVLDMENHHEIRHDLLAYCYGEDPIDWAHWPEIQQGVKDGFFTHEQFDQYFIRPDLGRRALRYLGFTTIENQDGYIVKKEK